MSRLADTPEPPYYAVIFTSLRDEREGDGYAETAVEMVELAALQPGFLGMESARDQGRLGVTVSYWRSLDDITAWKENARHLAAQRMGPEWYRAYRLRVARVERDGAWER